MSPITTPNIVPITAFTAESPLCAGILEFISVLPEPANDVAPPEMQESLVPEHLCVTESDGDIYSLVSVKARDPDFNHAWEQIERRYGRLPHFFASMFRQSGIGYPDLVQEGRLALVIGVDEYDPSFGTKISGYLAKVIFREVLRHVQNNGRLVRISVAMQQKIHGLRKAGRLEPTADEPADNASSRATSVEQLRTAHASGRTLSLNTPLHRNAPDGPTRMDNLPEKQIPIEDTLAIHRHLVPLLRALPPPHKRVLEMRYGLTADSAFEEMSLPKIGDTLGVSRERARQIESEALAMLAEIVEREQEIVPWHPWLYDADALSIIRGQLSDPEQQLFDLTFQSWVTATKCAAALGIAPEAIKERREALEERVDALYETLPAALRSSGI